MKNIYPLNFIMGFFEGFKRNKLRLGKSMFFTLNFVFLFSFLFFAPSSIRSQKLTFSYSYENITRNSTGGNS